MRIRYVVLGALVLLAAPRELRAQPTTPGVVSGGHVLTDAESQKIPQDEKPPLAIFSPAEDALIDPRMTRSWSAAPARLFVSTTVDIGFVYGRPRVAFGYGKPFTSWIGIEANPIVQASGLGAYGGVRLEIPFVDLRLGPRYFYAFNHTYLAPKPHYERIDLETTAGSQTQLLVYEAELDLSVPAGPGSIVGRGSVSYVTGVPDGQSAFEETLHVIVAPPLVWRARVGYAFRLGSHGQHSLGLIAEVLDIPKRDDSITLRAGPLVRMVLSRRVELRGIFVIPVVSPDRIGLIGGDFGELGVRYRWATE